MTTNYNGIIIKNFDLKKICSYKIGGKAKYYFIPDELIDLRNFLKAANKKQEKFYITGNGTNILFNDKFYSGTIISLKGFTNYIYLENNRIVSGAGVELNTLINFTINNSLKGIEKLSGIPGTFGGALVMNAGAFDTEIGIYVEYVKLMTYSGKIKTIQKDKIKFSYRKAIPLNKYIILEACLKLKKGNKNILKKSSNDVLKKRQETQPLDDLSCGSVFKRTEGCYPGTLIEKSRLKGHKIGGAQVSEKHCNFIINTGKAKAKDVMDLVKFVQTRVYKNLNIKLEPEIKFFNF